jgi:hypothetical protein
MKAELLAVPPVMLMGCHYTPQFCRRNRLVVMGLVNQATAAWEHWYQEQHEPAAVAAMAAAGYDLIELHFLYGFGVQHEAADLELTTRFVRHAHAAGMRVIGYFQFFSVQQETFFLEHPWARACVQRKADGTAQAYRYDRPALCFTHQPVREYYREGIALALGQCGLDGVRLDNDYYLGCYCEACQAAFRQWLAARFTPAQTRRVFGIATTAGMELVPGERPGDPLWLATVRFRQEHRQRLMQELADQVRARNPAAILGGNPVLSRRAGDPSRIHVYPPDLGATHHLVCAENDLFPGRLADGLRSQVVAYKHGQANDFQVFASHHLHDEAGQLRWPRDAAECALSLGEALAFGGHAVCTTWGLRQDGDRGTLYQRPEFMAALRPVSDFVRAHGDLYRGARAAARIGVYANRESLSGDAPQAAYALHGVVEALLTHHLPFRFIDRDEQTLAELELLIVPAMRFVSAAQVERLADFAVRHPLLLLGEACQADEWMLPHEPGCQRLLEAAPGVIRLALEVSPAAAWGERIRRLPRLPEAAAIAEVIAPHRPPPYAVQAPPWVALEQTRLPDGRACLHLLNFDHVAPATVSLAAPGDGAALVAPEGFGPNRVEVAGGRWHLHELRTYAVIVSAPGAAHGSP